MIFPGMVRNYTEIYSVGCIFQSENLNISYLVIDTKITFLLKPIKFQIIILPTI